MKVQIASTAGSGHHFQDVTGATRVEFTTKDGSVLFQITVAEGNMGGVPTLRVRAVEGVVLHGVYHGGALDVQPEASNTVALRLRRHPI